MLGKTVSLLMRGLLLALLLAVPPLADAAGDAGRHQVIGGVSIYLGILPVQMAKNEADDLNLPAKVYEKKERYYVLFALFDAESGRRIVDADVTASVQALGGLDYSEKKLTPVHIEKLVSYGNYFRMADPDLYHIKVKISLPGRKEAIDGRFDYQRPED